MVVLSSNDQFLLARHKNYFFANWKVFAYGTNKNKSLIQQMLSGQPFVIGRLGDG